MILYPAIDLKDGACVRLEQGDMARATVFGDDPAAQARRFADAGCEWIHVVDLNGAFAGAPVNGDAVRAIVDATDSKIQLGGGVRDMALIERWLAEGVARVVLGTAAVKQPGLVHAACQAFPGRIAVGIDAKGGRVAVEGWAEQSDLAAEELAARFADAGVAAIIYTDIDRDGVLAGPNVEATAALADTTDIPLIASGGVSSLTDLRRLKEAPGRGIAGVISGRALYEGRLDLTQALALLDEAC